MMSPKNKRNNNPHWPKYILQQPSPPT